MDYDPNSWFWQIADGGRIWSSARAAFIPADDATYVDWFAQGGAPTMMATEADLVAVLRAANVPPYHSVSTYRITRRLEDAGLIDAADAALVANKTLWRRFYTVGTIAADDVNARALLAAIGADADAILAVDAGASAP